jgi:hypothetical protein
LNPSIGSLISEKKAWAQALSIPCEVEPVPGERCGILPLTWNWGTKEILRDSSKEIAMGMSTELFHVVCV